MTLSSSSITMVSLLASSSLTSVRDGGGERNEADGRGRG